jgi:NTP pyrophosphatase (non-canonical NTP hydrolase)
MAFDKYKEFVSQVTSPASSNKKAFVSRIQELEDGGLEIHRLLTGAVGISAEAGEFMEIVKKIIFQGKPANEDNLEHLKIELGDILWYVAQACLALNISLEELTDMNIKKLSKRYPEGMFDAYYSENRAADDR